VIRNYAALFVAVLMPCSAFAQDLGLDLTDDSATKKEPPKKEEPPKRETSSASKKKEEAAPQESEGLAQKPAEGQQAEREVILEDRVKAVQRKVYLKKSRFEVSPLVGISVNDPYYSKFTVSALAAYYLADTLALGVRGSWINVIPTDDVRTAKHVLQSRIFVSIPQWSVMADAVWSPIYGKVTIFNSILHFDAYILGGMGAVITETSNVQTCVGTACSSPGPYVAFDLGVGVKFVTKDYLAVNAALINTSYVDTPTGTTQGITQNVMTLSAGISFFFPFKSTGRESE